MIKKKGRNSMKKYLLTIIVFFNFYSPIVKSDEFETNMKLDQLLEEVQILREEVRNLKKQIKDDVDFWAFANNQMIYFLATEVVDSKLSKKEITDLWSERHQNAYKQYKKME
jgi:hypothetical protein